MNEKKLKKWYSLDSDYKADVARLRAEAKVFYAEEDELRLESFKVRHNLNPARNAIYRKATNREERADMLEKLRLTFKQYSFLQKNYSD